MVFAVSVVLVVMVFVVLVMVVVVFCGGIYGGDFFDVLHEIL